MELTLLQREAIGWNISRSDSDLLEGSLGREVHTTLGYDRLLEERNKIRKRNALMQTLADLDIQPFTSSSVEVYKASCERTAHRRVAAVSVEVCGIGLLASLGALPVLAFSALFGFSSTAHYSAIVFLFAITCGVVGGIVTSRYSVERKWTMRKLSGYSEPVPNLSCRRR